MAVKGDHLGQRDACITCGELIEFNLYVFWADTLEVVPEGPPYRYLSSWQMDSATEQEKAEFEAYENWQKYRKERGVVNWEKSRESYYLVPMWFHLLAEEVTKIDEISRKCADGRRAALPKSFCMEQKTDYTPCWNKAKEILTDSEGRKTAICGLHMAHARKQQKEREEAQQTNQINRWRREALDERVAALKKFGIDATKETRDGKDWLETGKVIVDPEQLLTVLEETVGEVFL